MICLQTARVFWLGTGNISLSCSMFMVLVTLGRHTAEPLVPERSAFEVEMNIEKIKRHKLPGFDQIPADLIKAEGRKIRYEIHKFINSVWNKEVLPEDWKGSVIVPLYKKGDKTECSNYRELPNQKTTYKILSNILLSRLTPYAEEIIGDYQCGFQRNRSNADHILCIGQIFEKKWEYNETVHHLFIDFK